ADSLLRELGAFERLVMVYDQHIATLTGQRRARPLFELGRLYRDVLGAVHRTSRCFAEAHAADPELAEVWLPLANQRVVDDDVAGAIELYELALERGNLDAETRAFVDNRIAALTDDPDVISGETSGVTEDAAAPAVITPPAPAAAAP